MKIRKLVYEEKTSIDDFGIRDVGSLNELIYGEWLLTRKELRGDDRCILKVFNDTYYICTLALVKPDVRLQISYVLNEIEMPSVVIPLTRFYLSRLEQLPKATRWFWNSMEAVMEADWEVNQDSLKKIVSNDSSIITSDLFAPRVLTEELMSGLSEIEWRNATNGYEKDKIQMIVTALAKNKDVWQKMVETIKAAAQKYDYDYGFEDLVDDNGNVVYEFDINDNPNRIKVPKDPYDCEGNEILEPLKRAGVYQFCDELKERYEELVLEAPQPLGTNMDAKKEPTPCLKLESDMGISSGDKSIFEHVSLFVKNLVKEAIKTCCLSKASFALLEVTLYDHGQLKERNAHLPFLRELLDWGLLSDASKAEDLKKIVESVRDKARKLPQEGYKTWNDRPKDKLICEKIGKILGETMPYIR